MRPVETERKDPIGGSDFSHPAFGLLSVHRVFSGGKGPRDKLFGSEIKHHTYITITLKGATTNRSLSRNSHFGKGLKAEINMSEAQWASFLSSMNVGEGTPCTLRRFGDEEIPKIIDPKPKAEEFKEEFDDNLVGAKGRLDLLSEMVGESRLSGKAKEELKSVIGSIKADLGSNLDFTKDQFLRFMDKAVEEAKMNINGHALSTGSLLGEDASKAIGDDT